jgi:hypothetical protein
MHCDVAPQLGEAEVVCAIRSGVLLPALDGDGAVHAHEALQ